MTTQKRIGLLSSGKITPGINAALRATARTIFKYNDILINIEKGLDGLLDNELISMPHWSFFNGLLFKGGSILGLPEYGDPFKYPVIREGKIDYIDKSEIIKSTIEKFNIDVLIMLGSFDDIEIAKKLYTIGINIIFIPNIIHNDLQQAEYTFGFKTAVQTASMALDKLHSTAESHNRIFIVEVIGNKSGWIALESGISGGADVILIPEIPFKIEDIKETILNRIHKGSPFSLIVTSSGAKPCTYDKSYKKFSTINYLSQKLKEEISLEVRELSLNLIQMGGGPIAFDRVIASHYGHFAAKNACEFNKSGIIVFNTKIDFLPFDNNNFSLRLVRPDDYIIQTAKYLNISIGNEDCIKSF